MSDQAEKNTGQGQRFVVAHEQKTALYASEFIANLSSDGVILDCSSGFLRREGTGDMELPIHTRIAMSKSSAEKLIQLLTSVVQHANSADRPEQQATPAVPAA